MFQSVPKTSQCEGHFRDMGNQNLGLNHAIRILPLQLSGLCGSVSRSYSLQMNIGYPSTSCGRWKGRHLCQVGTPVHPWIHYYSQEVGYYEWLLLGVITLQPNNQGYNIMFGSPIKSTKVCIEQEEGLLTEMKQVCWTEKSAIYHILIQFHNDSDSFSFQLCITDSPEYQQIIDAWGLVSS